jgi:hypothetical protein
LAVAAYIEIQPAASTLIAGRVIGRIGASAAFREPRADDQGLSWRNDKEFHHVFPLIE